MLYDEDEIRSSREDAYSEGVDDGRVASLEDVLEALSEEVEELSVKGADAQGMVDAIDIVQEMLDNAKR